MYSPQTGAASHASLLVLAHGGPERLEDVPAFLREIRHGEVSDAVLEAALTRYGRIGGGSPMPAAARRIAAGLGEAIGLDARAAFRYSPPRIREAVAALADGGSDTVAAVCLAPHFSHAGPGEYLGELRDAARAIKPEIALLEIAHWHSMPQLVDYWAGAARAALVKAGSGCALLFTAHSLPLWLEPPDSPYAGQVAATGRAVADAIGLHERDWHVAYQSAVPGRGEWLGPGLDDVLAGLGGHVRHVIVAPVGFPCEQVETLYDLDVLLAQRVAAAGLGYTRLPTPQDDPALIRALATAVEKRLRPVPPAGRPAAHASEGS
jgi:ferrochelatase